MKWRLLSVCILMVLEMLRHHQWKTARVQHTVMHQQLNGILTGVTYVH